MRLFDDATLLYLLLLSNAAIVVAATLVILRFQAMIRRYQEFWASPTGAAVAGENQSQGRESAAGAAPNRELEQKLCKLQDTVTRMAKRKTEPAAKTAQHSVPMDNAVRMARAGASVDELTRNCGVSIGEAQLIRKLHGTRNNLAQA